MLTVLPKARENKPKVAGTPSKHAGCLHAGQTAEAAACGLVTHVSPSVHSMVADKSLGTHGKFGKGTRGANVPAPLQAAVGMLGRGSTTAVFPRLRQDLAFLPSPRSCLLKMLSY